MEEKSNEIKENFSRRSFGDNGSRLYGLYAADGSF
jgi:hypothetical protein